jgi:hypothetical protein
MDVMLDPTHRLRPHDAPCGTQPKSRHGPGDLQIVIHHLGDRLDAAVATVPARQRPLASGALLHLAVERLLETETAETACAILEGLAAWVARGGTKAS